MPATRKTQNDAVVRVFPLVDVHFGPAEFPKVAPANVVTDELPPELARELLRQGKAYEPPPRQDG